jgi:hypothetical protein
MAVAQRVAELESHQLVLEGERERLAAMLAQSQEALDEAYAETRRLNDLWVAAGEQANAALLESAAAAQRASEMENRLLVRTGERDALQDMLAQARSLTEEVLTEASRMNARIIEVEAELGRLRAESEVVLPHIDGAGALSLMRRFSAAGVPLFILRDGALAFRHEQRRRESRVVILSVPKSGTYMYGEILKEFGFIDSGVHGAQWGFADLRWGQKAEILSSLQRRNVPISLQHYIDLVRPGDFLLSHLPFEEETSSLLQPFRRILAIRDLRDCFVSYMRYAAKYRFLADEAATWPGLPEGPERMAGFAESLEATQFFKLSTPVLSWRTDPDVLVLLYEDIVGDNGPEASDAAIKRLGRHVGASEAGQVDLSVILGRDTITASGRRSRWQDYWNQTVDDAFGKLGGHALNEAILAASRLRPTGTQEELPPDR